MGKTDIKTRVDNLRQLIFLISLFLLFVVAVAFCSHLLGQWLAGKVLSDDKIHWGSVSDWFGGVVGVAIGFSGSAIAIWLAYRVETLTKHQNRLEDIQVFKDLTMSSGELEDAAHLAGIVCKEIQEIYSKLKRIQERDYEFSKLEEKVNEKDAEDNQRNRASDAQLEETELSKSRSKSGLCNEDTETTAPNLEKENLQESEDILEHLNKLFYIVIQNYPARDIEDAFKDHFSKWRVLIDTAIQRHIDFMKGKHQQSPETQLSTEIAKSSQDRNHESDHFTSCVEFLLLKLEIGKQIGQCYHEYQPEKRYNTLGYQLRTKRLYSVPIVLSKYFGRQYGGTQSEHFGHLPYSKFHFRDDTWFELNFVPLFISAVLQICDPYAGLKRIIECEIAALDLPEYYRDKLNAAIASPLRKVEADVKFMKHYFNNLDREDSSLFSVESVRDAGEGRPPERVKIGLGTHSQ